MVYWKTISIGSGKDWVYDMSGLGLENVIQDVTWWNMMEPWLQIIPRHWCHWLLNANVYSTLPCIPKSQLQRWNKGKHVRYLVFSISPWSGPLVWSRGMYSILMQKMFASKTHFVEKPSGDSHVRPVDADDLIHGQYIESVALIWFDSMEKYIHCRQATWTPMSHKVVHRKVALLVLCFSPWGPTGFA